MNATTLSFRLALNVLFFIASLSFVTLQAQTCNCKEYIYLNEPAASSILKFEVGPGLALTEVTGANGGPYWYPGTTASQLPSPHGLAYDLNGNLYIGSAGFNSTIRRLNCDGALEPVSGNTITNPGNQQNIFNIDNTIYVNTNGGPTAYNSCTGARLGQLLLNGAPSTTVSNNTAFNLWGLYFDKNTEIGYATQRSGAHKIWKFTRAELEAGVAGTGPGIDPIVTRGPNATVNPGENFLPNTATQVFGVVSDELGNIYVVKSGLTGAAGAYILKYNAAGQYIAQTATSPQNGPYGAAIGITYSESTKRLYVANFTDVSTVDCISAFNSVTMTYEGTAAPNPNIATNNTGKAIKLIKECCPVNLPATFTRNVCGAVDDRFFLNEEAFTRCDGVVCGSSWVPVGTQAGMVFDPCDNSVTITGTGCSTFTLDISAVTSTNCPAQSSTFTICNSSLPVITANVNCTSSTQYTVSGEVSLSSPPMASTLTIMDSQGASLVFNAPFVSPISYSFADLTNDGTTHTVSAVFSNSTNCTATTTYPAPQTESLEAGTTSSFCSTERILLASLGSSISPSNLNANWSTNGDGSFVGGISYNIATEYTPGPNDISNGIVNLSLTSTSAANCPPLEDGVEIRISRVNCGTFPWSGGQ